MCVRSGHIQGNIPARVCEPQGECMVRRNILSPGGYQGEGISDLRMQAEMGSPWLLQENADQAGAALVDDPFQGLLHPGAGLLGHVEQFGLQSLVHQIVEAFAEDVGLPDLDRVVLEVGQQALDQFLALALAAHNGAELGADHRTHHVYCLEQTEVFPRLRWMQNFSSSGKAFR